MANSRKNISFHTIEDRKCNFGCRLLFAQLREDIIRGKDTLHTHAFWQAEVILKGDYVLTSSGKSKHLRRGNIFIIPPGIAHQSEFRKRPASWISLKFNSTFPIPKAPIQYHPNQVKLSFPLFEAAFQTNSVCSPCGKAVLENLLNLLLEQPEPLAPSETPLHVRISEYVNRRNGMKTSVTDVAAAMNYSVNHVSADFSSKTGQTLKRYLDEQRVELAVDLLRYSDLRIAEVAECIDFPDPFSFSRFFKRLMGQSPAAFRKHE